MDLLYVFLELPKEYVSLLADRHRETFYYHAHLFALAFQSATTHAIQIH